MKTFLAYFDLLGYTKFIENNTSEHLNYRTDHFARNIEGALSLDEPLIEKSPGHVVSDISKSRLNCLNFSDTVIFWCNNATSHEFKELLDVSYRYNSFNVRLDFPSRGCIVYGEIWFKPFEQNNQRGGNYMLNMIYGKALVDAHQKAESMSWAGCVLDQSAIDQAKTLGSIDDLLREFTLKFPVPYKGKNNEEHHVSEYALRLFKGEALITKHYEEGISSAFTQDNKGKIEGRTAQIFANTIDFLNAHRVQFPYYYDNSEEEGGQEAFKIFGRLEEDFNHVIIERVESGNDVKYEIKNEKFDPQQSSRDFLDFNKSSKEIFEDHLIKAQEAK